MLGVVLWSDTNDNKAVIWCEDHGDLAYFNGYENGADTPIDFDAGDLVQFELTEERHQRLARNPRRLENGAYAGLPETLSDSRPNVGHRTDETCRADTSDSLTTAEVIPFSAVKARRDDRVLEIA